MVGYDFKLLDLYCGGGGAARGYERAGFKPEYIVGVDIVPQPHYPYRFIQMDALDFAIQYGDQFDAIHASPECKFATPLKHLHDDPGYTNQIPNTQRLLRSLGKPYVIENIPSARKYLYRPVMLCGTMFGLGTEGAELWRHRFFECHPFHVPIIFCNHKTHKSPSIRVISVVGHSGGKSEKRSTSGFSGAQRNEAMEIGWMNQRELSQAIPPAYTEYIGRYLLMYLQEPAAYMSGKFLEHLFATP